MAVNWYPLPEVIPSEEGWWERESSISDVRKDYLNVSCLTESSLLATPARTSTENDGRHLELSISSLPTATTTMDASSMSTPGRRGDSAASSHFRAKKGRGGQRVKFTPELEVVTELDELWRRFQSSSLEDKENRGVVRCTCQCGRNKDSKERRDTREMRDWLSEVSSTTAHNLPRRSVLVEKAVQTSPAPPPSVTHPPPICHVTRSPSIAFTIPIRHEPAMARQGLTLRQSAPQKCRPTSRQSTREKHSELTLSEAFALSHPEFIEASLRRQRELRQRHELRSLENLQTRLMNKQRRPHPPLASPRFSSYTPTSAVHTGPASGRSHGAKMTKRDMYNASKRVWSQLPEVKAREEAEKRKSRVVTNRIRMKAYQQEVLLRLRRLNKKKQ